ncbi:MAG: DUF1684 domain-containing protein [Polyangiaceae bacterium]
MTSFEEETEAWHRARTDRLRSPDGWLALVAKAFLEPGMSLTVGADASCDVRLPVGPALVGRIARDDAGIVATLEPGVATLAGAPVEGALRLRTDASPSPDRLQIGAMRLDVMERGDAMAIRVRDPEAPARVGLGRIDRFPVDVAYRVTARFVAEPERRELVDFGSGIADEMVSPGHLEVTLGAERFTLRALYEDAERKRLYVLFRDGTSGHESYGLGRFVYAPLPDASGQVVVDFNRAMLPGCAFNDLATCPIPAKENRIATRITAGEKSYAPTGA